MGRLAWPLISKRETRKSARRFQPNRPPSPRDDASELRNVAAGLALPYFRKESAIRPGSNGKLKWHCREHGSIRHDLLGKISQMEINTLNLDISAPLHLWKGLDGIAETVEMKARFV